MPNGCRLSFSPVRPSAHLGIAFALLSFSALAATPTATMLSSLNNPVVYGELITFTVTVSPMPQGAGTPTGNVSIFSGNLLVGSIALNGGMGSFNYSGLPASTSNFTATYLGDGNFATSTSTAVSQTINPDNSIAVTTSTPNPSAYGQSVTLTATVSAAAPGSGTPTGGAIQFFDGITSLGSATLANGTASVSTSVLSGGTHLITSVYAGDPNFNGSTSPNLIQTVNRADTTAVANASISTSVFGQSVTFTATVSAVANGIGTPTGTATFFAGAAMLGAAPLNGSGVATLSSPALPLGSSSVTVQYNGDSNFNSSTSSALAQTVTPAGSSVALTSDIGASVFGQTVTLTATISALAPGSGTPSGTVVFFDGGNLLGTAPVNVQGLASLSTSVLSTGTRSLSAAYGGDVDFRSSTSANLSQIVNAAQTTATLSLSHDPSVFGETVTLKAVLAAVAPSARIPGGTVVVINGATVIGTVAADSSGTATIGVSSPVGTRTFAAVYGGSADFVGSTSASVAQTVNQASSIVSIVSSASPSVLGQPVTFTASVSAAAPGSGAPGNESVAFFDGISMLGTALLDNSGTAAFTVSNFTSGVHGITVTYGGDANFIGSTSSSLTQIVKFPSTVTVVSAQSPAIVGEAVAFTATVTSTGGAPDGAIMLLDGQTSLGSAAVGPGGTSLFSISTLAAGTHNISAVYAGNAGIAGSNSAILNQVIVTASSSTVVTASSGVVVMGGNTTFTAVVSASLARFTPTAIPTGTVTFSEGATLLGTGTLANGEAVFSTTALAQGVHAITGAYGGDAGFAASVSLPVTVVILTPGPKIVSGVTANPNPATIGQPVQFGFSATDTAPFVVNWDFGDGATDTSNTSTPVHTFAAAGSYTITATAQNAAGQSVSDRLTLSVAPAGSPGELVGSLGGNNPFGGATPPPVTMTINSLKVSLNFVKRGRDVLFVNATFATPVAVPLKGQFFAIDIGGVIKMFTLDSRGSAKVGIAQIKVNSKTSRFTFRANGGSFSNTLATSGLTNKDASNAKVSIPVAVVIGTDLFEATQALLYNAKQGFVGIAK